MKKTYLSALSLSLAASAIVVAAPTQADAAVSSFKDVKPSLDHYDAIMNLAERGIVKGYEDGTFRPDAKLTRAHASKILALSLGLDTKNVKDPGFKDLNPNQWHYEYVAALANAGYIQGFEDGTFRPNDPMTRAHTAKILDLSYKLPDGDAANPFTDVRSDSWYVGHVLSLVENNITKGKTATTFEPNANVTRAQMASFVIRTEHAVKVVDAIAEAKATLRAIVQEHGVVEKDGKKLAEASYDPTTNTLTLTAYDMDEGIKAVQGSTGLFSEKILDAGVTGVRIADGAIVTVNSDRAAAKEQLQKQLASLLAPSTDQAKGDLVADNVKVTVYGEKDGLQFSEDVNVNLRVFIPAE